MFIFGSQLGRSSTCKCANFIWHPTVEGNGALKGRAWFLGSDGFNALQVQAADERTLGLLCNKLCVECPMWLKVREPGKGKYRASCATSCAPQTVKQAVQVQG